ncbi:MAG TPA: isochorismatase family cysteine hydrolase [Chloroflexia bacterium]|nr:isochorismatase family cysteine hydrolase [Chloroflexia bacterium]
MPARNEDLHGNVPDSCEVALLIIDMINDLEFEGAEMLVRYIKPVAEKIAALKRSAKQAGVPVIYVNDNYGRWQSDLNKLVEHCLNSEVRGKPIVELLTPDDDDYFVLKPKHSGFYSTTLDVLLEYLKVKTLVLTGVAGNICVLFTANDAYMRDFFVIVPPDCTASNEGGLNQQALDLMKTVLKAELIPSSEIDWEALKAGSKGAEKV